MRQLRLCRAEEVAIGGPHGTFGGLAVPAR